MDTTDKVRETRLRRMAYRQGLILRKSRTRDPRAVGHGMYCLSDFENRAVAGTDLMGYSMNLDEVEVFLADAQDFDVYFEDPLGDYRQTEKPFLEWNDRYWFGRRWTAGWLLTERDESPDDHFILAGRTELAQAAIVARDMVEYWNTLRRDREVESA